MTSVLIHTRAFLKMLALLGVVALLLVFGSRTTRAQPLPPFTPTYTQTIDEVAPSDPFTLPSDDDCPVGAACKHMFQLTVPDGQPGHLFFPGLGERLLVPSSVVSVAADALVPDGAIIQRQFGSLRVGPIGNCSTSTVIPFEGFVFDATTDPATTTGSHNDIFSFDHWPTQLNGIRDETLANNPGAVLHRRGLRAGDLVSTKNSLLFKLSDGSLLAVNIYGDPTAPPQFENCGPTNFTAIDLGTTMDNPDTGPDEGGIPLFTCTGAGTQTYQLLLDRNDTPPGDEVTLFDTATCSPNTQPGSDVSVPLLGGTESVGGVEVTFLEVATEGSTSVTGGSEGPPPPTGFEVIGLSGQSFYYDINTTATYSGPVTVCVRYDDSGLTPDDEDDLRLMQNVDGDFVDRTSSRDTGNNIICGTALSFSVWAVMARLPAIEVEIDIKPGGDPNSINLSSQGVIPVAVLSTNPFDATTVDPATVEFAGTPPLRSAQEDVDTDGHTDLIMHFRTQAANIAEDATEACLTGETFGGEQIEGCDSVRIVPPEADADGDSLGLGLPRIFGDDVEATLGTDQFAACGESAWPPDLNDDGIVDVQDINAMVPRLFSAPFGPPYDVRFDLFDPSGAYGPIVIDVQDFNAMVPRLFQSCGLPP